MVNQNQNTPESNQVRATGKELLDSLKEQLRLEGDYRDILRDSVRELQKAIKQHDTIAAKLEAYSTSTINIRQVQTEINNNLVKQNINKIKLIESATKLGGLESDQVKIADEYLTELERRSDLEGDYINKRQELISFENKFKEIKRDEYNSLNDYYNKLEDQRKLELYIASLSERGLADNDLVVVAKRRELDALKNQISLQEQSFSIDQQGFINARNIFDQAKQSVDQQEEKISSIQQGLNLEQAAYIQAKKTNDLYQSNNEKLKSQEDFEKRSQKNAGILGGLIGGLANKFGIAEQVQKDMVEQQKILAADALASGRKSGTFYDKLTVAKTGIKSVGKGLVDSFKTDPVFKYGAALGVVGLAYKGLEKGLTMVGDAAAKAGNFMAGLSQDSSNMVRGLTSGLSDIARKIPLVGGVLGGFIDGFSAILDLVIGVDNFIVKSGRDLNLNTQEARALNREFQNISFNSGNIFTTSRKLLESQVELSNQLGVVNILTKEQLETNIMLKDITGLELETRQQIAEVSTITGQTSQNVVKSVLAQVEGLKNATGIQLQNKQVLKEAANLGGYLGLQFAKYPANLTKSLVTVKAMGMELKQLDSIADSFLDFESSISKEFEAQLLTGKDINLTKARELFLNNDLAGAAAEITSQVGSANDFLKLNRIQAESLASAFGMSRDQMGEMLKRQELLSKLGAKDTDNAQKQLQIGLQRYQSQEALSAAIGEEAYQNLVNASTQEKMASIIEKIKQSIVDFVENSGIIEKVQSFIDYISKPENIGKILTQVRDTFADVADVVLTITNGVINTLDILSAGFAIDEDWERKFEKWSESVPDRIRSMGGNFESLSVGTNAANSQVKSTTAPVYQQPDNRMVANPSNNVPMAMNVSVTLSDGVNQAKSRYATGAQIDTRLGKIQQP
jgi:hypothetical protein